MTVMNVEIAVGCQVTIKLSPGKAFRKNLYNAVIDFNSTTYAPKTHTCISLDEDANSLKKASTIILVLFHL